MNTHGHHWIRNRKRKAIYARDGHQCVYCGLFAYSSADTGPCLLTLDHLVPRELGGSNEANNLVTACHRCNSARQSKGIRAWFAVLRRRGVNTDKIGPRIRRLLRKPLQEKKT